MAIPTIHTAEPAYSIIEKLGGKGEVSEKLRLDKSTLSRWCQPRPHGTGGMIPVRYWPMIIVMGRQRGVDVRLEELAGVEA